MKVIRSFFHLRPRFLSTIFFIPILYGIGWALSQPLLLFNFEEENLSLIGTIITFFLFIFLLPYWFYIKRNKSSAWILLGITKDKFLKNFVNFSKGILFSLVLIDLSTELRILFDHFTFSSLYFAIGKHPLAIFILFSYPYLYKKIK